MLYIISMLHLFQSSPSADTEVGLDICQEIYFISYSLICHLSTLQGHFEFFFNE